MAEYWTTAPYEPLPERPRTRFFPVHEGRTMIVTGAAGGIGKALVRQLVAEGARVAAWDIQEVALAELSDEHPAGAVETVACDLGEEASIKQAFRTSIEKLGQIDGVVNNAAIVRRGDPLDVSWDDWRSSMAVNVYGPYELARIAARSMAERGIRGSIVNVASEAGKKGHTQSLSYGATKAAVINMTRILSVSLAPYDINVNCVCPGGVGTEMLRAAAANMARVSGAETDTVFSKIGGGQLKRHITPAEVARTISFLLSDDAMIIRGQAVNTDGGGTPY